MIDTFWGRRIDALTGSAVVLAVDAVVFLMTALIGAPFLLFFLADENSGLDSLWPFGTVLAVSAVLGAAAAASAYLIAERNTPRMRPAGGMTALAIAVGTGALVVTSAAASPVLAAVAALLMTANLTAAKALFTPEPVLPALVVEEPVPDVEDEPAEVVTRDTIEFRPGSRPLARRRPRGPAAMRTMAGVRLPRRARTRGR